MSIVCGRSTQRSLGVTSPSMTTSCPKCAQFPVFRTELEKLDRFRQRVTYEAFGGALSTNKRSPLQGHIRDALHSWVVAKGDGEPSGYKASEKHAELRNRDSIISDDGALRAWLKSPS